MTAHNEWYLDQPVRLPSQQRGRVERLTPTLVVLTDGTRWSRKTGILYGVGPTATRIEPWDTRKGAEETQ